jgi:hypothetical protein
MVQIIFYIAIKIVALNQSSPQGEIEWAPNTPVLKGIGKFVEWYKTYFGIQ